jgi:hypothetical protein
VLPKDPKNIGRYDIHYVRKSSGEPGKPPEPPPERIEDVPLTPYDYGDDDPNDIY